MWERLQEFYIMLFFVHAFKSKKPRRISSSGALYNIILFFMMLSR